jgi:hypothetical protein
LVSGAKVTVMSRTLAAFLLLFSLLSFVVKLDRSGLLFGVAAVVVFVIDVLLAYSLKTRPPVSRIQGGLL